MRTKIRLPFYLPGTVFLFALLVSCENKPDFVGKDLLPSGDNFVVLFDSMEVIHGYTRPGDSLSSVNKDNYLIGSLVDPFFGFSKSSIVTTISSSINSRGFGLNARADSVILYLAVGEKVDEGSLPFRLQVFEWTELLHPDSIYYSNMDITGKYRDVEIGSATVVGGDTAIRIFITDPEFINKFLTAQDSTLRNDEYLQKYMNGLYLTTNDVYPDAGMVEIDFDDSRNYLYFYYRNDTSVDQKQYYSFESNYNGRINLFEHDPGGYPLEEYLNSGSRDDSLIFVQSLAGVSSVISFPGLSKWVDSMPIAINEARLILPVADTTSTMQDMEDFPDYLNLYVIQNAGGYSLSYDQILNSGSYGGNYDSDEMAYTFTLKVQLQSLLKDSTPNLTMALFSGNASQSVKRAALYGWNSDPQKRIRLEITYTKL